MIRLAILICHNPKEGYRIPLLEQLLKNLYSQRKGLEEFIEILVDSGQGTIGEKRNRLLAEAGGMYVAFIDDDDNVSDRYIQLQLGGIQKDVDCCSLKGIINERGTEKAFIHSLRYEEYADNGTFFERYPNHLNCIRYDIARRFQFPAINHGEDTDWATQIHKSGLLKTEYWIDEVLYFYNPSSNRK